MSILKQNLEGNAIQFTEDGSWSQVQQSENIQVVSCPIKNVSTTSTENLPQLQSNKITLVIPDPEIQRESSTSASVESLSQLQSNKETHVIPDPEIEKESSSSISVTSGNTQTNHNLISS